MQLFFQIVYSVLLEFKTYSEKGKRNTILLYITKSQEVEISIKYDFYWKLFVKESKIFYRAFVAKNHIYHADTQPQNTDEMTPDEIRELLKTQAMMNNIEKGNLLKQLQ